jgi:predicted transcriptional regulator
MSTKTGIPKQHLLIVLEEQPDDSSYDELLRELAFARMIDRGLTDATAGRTIDNDELRREIASWQIQK